MFEPWTEDEKVSDRLLVFEGDKKIHIRPEFLYPYQKDSPKTLTTLETIAEETITEENPQFWSITVKDIRNDAELGQFVRDQYGSGCEINPMEKGAQEGTFYVSPRELVAASGSGIDCLLNYVTVMIYAPDLNKAVHWNIGRDFNLWGKFDHYELRNSFRFLTDQTSSLEPSPSSPRFISAEVGKSIRFTIDNAETVGEGCEFMAGLSGGPLSTETKLDYEECVVINTEFGIQYVLVPFSVPPPFSSGFSYNPPPPDEKDDINFDETVEQVAAEFDAQFTDIELYVESEYYRTLQSRLNDPVVFELTLVPGDLIDSFIPKLYSLNLEPVSVPYTRKPYLLLSQVYDKDLLYENLLKIAYCETLQLEKEQCVEEYLAFRQQGEYIHEQNADGTISDILTFISLQVDYLEGGVLRTYLPCLAKGIPVHNQDGYCVDNVPEF